MSGEFACRNILVRDSKTYKYGINRNGTPEVIVRGTKSLTESGIDIEKLVSILPRGWTHDHFIFNVPYFPNLPELERFFPPKNRKKIF
jgi:hypothetical protein